MLFEPRFNETIFSSSSKKIKNKCTYLIGLIHCCLSYLFCQKNREPVGRHESSISVTPFFSVTEMIFFILFLFLYFTKHQQLKILFYKFQMVKLAITRHFV